MWEIDPKGVNAEHWLDVISDDIKEDELHYYWHASVRPDGCIHLNHAGNEPYSIETNFAYTQRACNKEDTYIHICDLDDYINRLTALRDVAKKHFGDKWPD